MKKYYVIVNHEQSNVLYPDSYDYIKGSYDTLEEATQVFEEEKALDIARGFEKPYVALAVREY